MWPATLVVRAARGGVAPAPGEAVSLSARMRRTIEATSGLVDEFPRAPNEMARLAAALRRFGSPAADVDRGRITEFDDDITRSDGKAAMATRQDLLLGHGYDCR